jgi:hypothetical protein
MARQPMRGPRAVHAIKPNASRLAVHQTDTEGSHMKSEILRSAVCAVLLTGLAACGGGGSSMDSNSNPPPPPEKVSMPLVISDASSEDWATIGVKILSVALVPADGSANVNVYTAPSPVPVTNLVQLDDLGDIIGNPSVPANTYVGAVLTVSANPGDVTLVTSSDPEAGFAAPASTAISPSDVQIQGAKGSTGSLSVPINIKFESPVMLSSSATSLVDLEFDLSHPAFIIGHNPPALAGTTLWAVNFDGPVRHHPVHDIAGLVLRHMYGSVNSVASDNMSFAITKDVATYPAVNPETAESTGVALQIQVDGTNGTLFYDVDGKTVSTIKDFSSVAALLGQSGEYVRVAARYQENGTLVAVRVWASQSFNSVWVSPEGHVRHVDTTNDVMMVDDENGHAIPITVDANTKFFYRTPADALADATPIATGTGFLAANDLVRGFKVHVSVVDVLQQPLVADTVDIETAAYSGRISIPTMSAFTYTHDFFTAADDYSVTLPYIADTTPNGKDASGNVIDGFKWWYFTFPTLADTGASAIGDYIAATNTPGLNFGGLVGTVAPWGVSGATWADSANPSGWSARWTVLSPVRLPLASVASAYANGAFMISLDGNTGGNAASVTVDTSTGQATLVYQVDRTNGIVTVSPIDVTTGTGQAALAAGLVNGAPVKVWGVPSGSSLKAYVIAYYTGTLPET